MKRTVTDFALFAHRKEQGPLYHEVEGCPIHDITYFHGDQSRHEGASYQPCVECEKGDAA